MIIKRIVPNISKETCWESGSRFGLDSLVRSIVVRLYAHRVRMTQMRTKATLVIGLCVAFLATRRSANGR